MSARPLALALGDPAGIGPELIVELWCRAQGRAATERAIAPFFVCGGAEVLREAARRRGVDCAVAPIDEPGEAAEIFARALPVLGEADGAYRPGQPDDEGARLALASLEQAAALALEGHAGALVTAPVAKERLAAVGFDFPGQTEFLSARCGQEREAAVMMLAGPSLRCVPVTVHIALGDVARALSSEAIVRKARVLAEALRRDFAIARPRLAVAGLNPHAGENGRFGDEEARIIAPAIEQLRADGLWVSGPHSPDAMFSARARAEYDAAVCMYHDQALIPLKTLDFDRGVNVTLGLPIVRCSPDHGTAFAIAGQRKADPGAMVAAARMASAIAANRADG